MSSYFCFHDKTARPQEWLRYVAACTAATRQWEMTSDTGGTPVGVFRRTPSLPVSGMRSRRLGTLTDVVIASIGTSASGIPGSAGQMR